VFGDGPIEGSIGLGPGGDGTGDSDSGTAITEPEGDLLPDAGVATDDDDHLAIQPRCHGG
jgi:hypothetical protein